MLEIAILHIYSDLFLFRYPGSGGWEKITRVICTRGSSNHNDNINYQFLMNYL